MYTSSASMYECEDGYCVYEHGYKHVRVRVHTSTHQRSEPFSAYCCSLCTLLPSIHIFRVVYTPYLPIRTWPVIFYLPCCCTFCSPFVPYTGKSDPGLPIQGVLLPPLHYLRRMPSFFVSCLPLINWTVAGTMFVGAIPVRARLPL